MSLPLPRLDDRTWQDLRDEGVSLIPRYAPNWTDHNATDPGVTLIELLAYHTEIDLYRLDRIGDPHLRAFLRLFGPGRLPGGPRPAATLLQYELPAGQRPRPLLVRTGDYFVPRLPPSRATADRRPRQESGVGEPVKPPPLRRAGEPDEPLLRADAVAESQVPEFGFRAAHEADLTGVRLAAVQSFDGRQFRDLSDVLFRTRPAAVWGDDPVPPAGRSADRHPALYLGLELTLVVARPPGWLLTLWCVPSGLDPADPPPDDLADDPRGHPVAPPHPGTFVKTGENGYRPHVPPEHSAQHHGLVVHWEYWNGSTWRSVSCAPSFRDDTRGFTRPGRVVIPGEVFADGGAVPVTVGAAPASHVYIRCRLSAGLPDRPPVVRGIFPDAVLVEQWDRTATPLRPTLMGVGVPPATLRELQLSEETEADVAEAANDLAIRGWGPVAAGWGSWPLWGANGFDPADPNSNPPFDTTPLPQTNRYTVRAVVVGVGDGKPGQQFPLPCPPGNTAFAAETASEDEGPPLRVVSDTLRVWTLEPPWGWDPTAPRREATARWEPLVWKAVPDLLPGPRKARQYRFEATPSGESARSRYASPGRLVFGDGQNGRVPSPGAVVIASYSWTVAEAANFAAGYIWARSTERDPTDKNRVVEYPTVRFKNPLPATGGRIEEPLSDALRRLVIEFDATERVLRLADGKETLDGVVLTEVPTVPAPVNGLDFECLARRVPGTAVARARAWAEVDPRYPGRVAPGAVTVVIVPHLPDARPLPTDGLLHRVRAYLDARRPLTCRVFVVGPEYATVRVQATLHASSNQVTAVRTAAADAVRAFLHPTRGGPTGTGWPFGRDVHTGELMRILAGVKGVRYVTGLRLAGADGVWTEEAVGVPAQALVALADPVFDVRGGA